MGIFNKRRSWRDEYIKVLQDGPDHSQTKFALELIKDGYADGLISRECGVGDTAPYVRWQGVNTKGRLFLDDLIEQKRKESLLYKIKIGALALGGWLVGVVTSIFLDLVKCM